MMKSLEMIVAYVEGKISTRIFEQALYHDVEMEEILSEKISIPPYTNDGSLFLYLLNENLNTSGGHLNSVDALAKYLDLKNIPFVLDTNPEHRYQLILDVQPDWLDIRDDDYWNSLLEQFKDKTGKALATSLKDQIKRDFRFLKKKPSWLQAPEWPIENNKPLLFIGQLDISAIRHDTTSVYLFFNEVENKYVTIEQSM